LKKIIYKKILLVAFSFALTGAAFSAQENQDVQKITIQEAVQMALENNIDLRNAILNKQALDQQIKQYYASAYPSVNLSGNYNRGIEKPYFFMGGTKVQIGADNEYNSKIELTQTLFSGFRVNTGIQIAKKSAAGGLYLIDKTRNLIRQTVYEICYRIMLSDKLYHVEEENFEIAKKHLKLEQARYDAGISSSLDVLRQKVRVANAEPSYLRAKGDYETNYLYLKDALNLDPDEKIELVWNSKDFEKPQVEDLQRLYQLAAMNRPDIQIAKINYEIAEKRIKVEKGARYPSLDLVAERDFTGQGDGNVFDRWDQSAWGSSVGLKLSIPLFEGGKITSLISQREIERDMAYNNYLDLLRKIRIEVKEAYLDLKTAQLRIAASEDSVEQARENLYTLEEQYRSGVSSQLDMLDATQALNETQLLYIQAVYDQFEALARLEYVSGVKIFE